MARKIKAQVSELASLVAVATATPEVAAPTTSRKAKLDTALSVELTTKGRQFAPRGKSEVSITKDAITWQAIRTLFADNAAHTLSEVYAVVGAHRSYVAYTLKHGWLSAQQAV